MMHPTLVSLLIWAGLINYVYSVGMIIDPVLEGDGNKMSGLKNLQNCLGYPTNDNELLMVKIQSGERIPSQYLNLKVIDSEDNLLRFTKDLYEETTILLKNSNNEPIYDENNQKRSNIIDKLPFGKSSNPHKLNKLLNSDKGKNLIYICFDNVYSDKSWSFTAQPRELDLQVHLRDVSQMAHTDYNKYSKFFQEYQSQDNKNKKVKEMNEEQFGQEISVVINELHNVVENLENSQLILQNILDQESLLRDVNEQIYSGYSLFAIILLVTIIIFGLFQAYYMRSYLTKKVPY